MLAIYPVGDHVRALLVQLDVHVVVGLFHRPSKLVDGTKLAYIYYSKSVLLTKPIAIILFRFLWEKKYKYEYEGN
jgi:hypothetical protein